MNQMKKLKLERMEGAKIGSIMMLPFELGLKNSCFCDPHSVAPSYHPLAVLSFIQQMLVIYI